MEYRVESETERNTLHAVPELNREMLTFNLEEMLRERVFLCNGREMKGW